ncbi:MAG: hypothetical protein IAF58_16160 [Leptolyngbya sp.]|nr:hypothetical protein [Candidatus Melainabacteria bacterium]
MRRNISIYFHGIECFICILALTQIHPVVPALQVFKWVAFAAFGFGFVDAITQLRTRRRRVLAPIVPKQLRSLHNVALFIFAIPIIGYVGTSDLLCRTDIIGQSRFAEAVDAQKLAIECVEGKPKSWEFLDRLSKALADRAENSELSHRYRDAVIQYGLADWASCYGGRHQFEFGKYNIAIAHCHDQLNEFVTADKYYRCAESAYNLRHPEKSDLPDSQKFVCVSRVLRLLNFVSFEDLSFQAPYLVEALSHQNNSGRDINDIYIKVPLEPKSICLTANSFDEKDSVWLDFEEVEYKLYKANPRWTPQVMLEFRCLYPLMLDERHWFNSSPHQVIPLLERSLLEQLHEKWNYAPLNRRVLSQDIDIVPGKRIILTASQHTWLNNLSGISGALGESRYGTHDMATLKEDASNDVRCYGMFDQRSNPSLNSGINNAKTGTMILQDYFSTSSP